MIFKNVSSSAVLLAASLAGGLFTTSAFATPIQGVLQISGNVQVSGTNVANGVIDFLPLGTALNPTGTLNVLGFQNTGDFSVYNTGSITTETIKDLTAGIVGPDFIANFITLSKLPAGTHLDLTAVSGGSDPATDCDPTKPALVGQVCTPTGSPFNLQNVSTLPNPSSHTGQACTVTGGGTTSNDCNVVIGFNVTGTITSGTGGVSNFIGALSTQDTGRTYQEILTILGGGGSIGDSFSGTITATLTPTPEPGSFGMLLAGVGMFALGAFGKKHYSARN